MREIAAATHNEGKLRELRALLAPAGFSLASLFELGVSEGPEETGASFAENALLKARFAVARTGRPAFADDSGLEVRVLGGAPGVRSARFGAPEAVTDADRAELLLRRMEGERDRDARFVCCVVLLFPDGQCYTAEGVCRGEITRAPRGCDGFGYDPVFFLPEHGLTLAEASEELKNAVSHRGRAVQNLLRNIMERDENALQEGIL